MVGIGLGYFAGWPRADVYDRLAAGCTVTAIAEKVNPDAPAHVRLLYLIDAPRR